MVAVMEMAAEAMVTAVANKMMLTLILLSLGLTPAVAQEPSETIFKKRNENIQSQTLEDLTVEKGFFIQGTLQKSQLRNCRISGTIMNGAKVYSSTVQNCQFDDSSLAATIFANSKILNTSFKNSKMIATKFIQSRLTNVDFFGADLRDAVFLLCTFDNVRFDDATKLPFSIETAKSLGMVHVRQ